ncbi:MAG: hypothetical protein SFU21_02515 [Flavihumibacter sp.]|nr:hypothetical protein [Flavihumibacter sp.]
MKLVKYLCSLLAIAVLLVSCQKEYSKEVPKNGATGAEWAFKEATNALAGPVDTAFITKVGAINYLIVEGSTSDKKDAITIEVYAVGDIKAGTYSNPNCDFTYTRNGKTIYEVDPTAIGEFSVVITKIDSATVSGTFAGKVLDSTGAIKTITDGKFNGKLKTTTAATGKGDVMFWSKQGCGPTSSSPIAITIGSNSGTITTFTPVEPTSCGLTGTVSLNLAAGSYTYKAKCANGDSIVGTVTVIANTCTKVQVSFVLPTTGDYFPTTANSNWTYLAEGAAPSDSTYVFSTGTSKVINTKTYSILIYDQTDSGFYRKASGEYFEHIDAANNPFPFDSPTGYEVPFLKDNVPAGSTWVKEITGTISGQAVVAKEKFSILQVGATETVGGITFQNVIKVRRIYAVAALGSETELYKVDVWFAKDKGLIKFIEVNTPPTPNTVINVTRLQVF